jgi:dTMP kinase
MGAFITLEGGEGAGKSTQIKRLERRLEVQGKHVITTREPGGTPEAERVRNLLVTGDSQRWDALSEALLIFAARRHHVENLIKPVLKTGSWVLCDRFFDSTLVYQGIAGDAGPRDIETLRRLVLGDFAPDLTLILDLPAEEGLRRAAERTSDRRTAPEDRFENKGLEFHQRLRAAYMEILEAEPQRCALIDGSKSEDAVETEIWAAVQLRLEDRGL